MGGDVPFKSDSTESKPKPGLEPGENVVYKGMLVKVHTPKFTEISLTLPDGSIVMGVPLFQGLLHKKHLLFE